MHTISDAHNALAEGNIDGARAICTDLVARNLSADEANRILAQLSLQAGDLDSGTSFLEAAHAANPTNLDVLRQLAALAESSKRWTDVSAYCEKIIELRDRAGPKKHYAALLNLVVALLRLHRREDAIAPGRELKRLLESPEIEAYSRHTTGEYCFSLLALLLRDDDLATKSFTITKSFRVPNTTAVVSDFLTTRQWCLENGETYETIDPPQDMIVRCGSGGLDAWRYRSEGSFFARIPGGGMVPQWDFVIAPDGRVLSDAGLSQIDISSGFLPHYRNLELFHSTILRAKPTKTVAIDEDALFLSNPVKFHPTHWMIDYMPRLRGLGLAPGGKPKLAVPANLPQRHRDFLKYFGVSDTDLILCKEDTFYTFRNLYVFKTDTSDRPIPGNVEFLGRALRGGGRETAPRRGARYYLTRASARSNDRNVRNEADFNALLRKFGFESVDIGLLSIDEQISKIKDAELLLGPTGSNLIAVYYAPRGCPVIEMIPDPADNPATGPHCRMLGAEHEFFLCERTPCLANNLLYDIVVDCDKLNKLIEERLGLSA